MPAGASRGFESFFHMTIHHIFEDICHTWLGNLFFLQELKSYFPSEMKTEELTDHTSLMENVIFFLTSGSKWVYFLFIYFLKIYFWLRWVFVAACGLSLVAASGGYSS